MEKETLKIENKNEVTNVTGTVNMGRSRFELNYSHSDKRLIEITAMIYSDDVFMGNFRMSEQGGVSTSTNDATNLITNLTTFLQIVDAVKKEVEQ